MTVKTGNVTATRQWSASSVRRCCIEHDLYTLGDNAEYEQMLEIVESSEPTIENIYKVSRNIWGRSNSQFDYVSTIMYFIENEAVTTRFDIDDEE